MIKKKVLRINAKDPHLRGLMSYLLQVLNNLKWCDENEYTPLVDLCGPSYWLHDKEYGANIWEYFFAPVSDITLDPTEEEIENETRHDEITRFLLPVDGYDKKVILYEWMRYFTETRKDLNEIFKKYVKIRADIVEDVEDFWKQSMMDERVVGVQIRGTDTTKYGLKIQDYIDETHKYLKDNPATKIYVASDTHEALNVFKKEFDGMGNVLHLPLTRQKNYIGASINGRNNWSKAGFKSPKDAGDEILKETMLLSRCSHIIHQKSSVAMCALIMNINTTNTFMLEQMEKGNTRGWKPKK
jgi:phage baseplate assembly protein W